MSSILDATAGNIATLPLLVLDLARFKEVKDTLNQRSGYELLRQVAIRVWTPLLMWSSIVAWEVANSRS
jgi:GGDEF domain-containing protein